MNWGCLIDYQNGDEVHVDVDDNDDGESNNDDDGDDASDDDVGDVGKEKTVAWLEACQAAAHPLIDFRRETPQPIAPPTILAMVRTFRVLLP